VQTFAFPPRPAVSRRCMDLVAQLIREREYRLCSKRYYYRDQALQNGSPPPRSSGHAHRDWKDCSVFPHDAEDIKLHKWFRDMDWKRLNIVRPPFVPEISSLEDTHYFDEEESISDWPESQPDSSCEDASADSTRLEPNPLSIAPTEPRLSAMPGTPASLLHTGSRRSPQRLAVMQARLSAMPRALRQVMTQFVAAPYDSTKLKHIHRDIEAMTPDTDEADRLKDFVRYFGRRERKRPRDRLLRDRGTKGVVLEIRKKSAFLGYTWKRLRAWDRVGADEAMGRGAGWGPYHGGLWLGNRGSEVTAHRAWFRGRASG
jgi:protein-serine/threonine kinase